jgi:hypothetical protein
LLRARLVSWLLLTSFIANNALIAEGMRTRLRSRHTLLSTVLSALILLTFQIIFLWHIPTPDPLQIFNCLEHTRSSHALKTTRAFVRFFLRQKNAASRVTTRGVASFGAWLFQ